MQFDTQTLFWAKTAAQWLENKGVYVEVWLCGEMWVLQAEWSGTEYMGFNIVPNAIDIPLDSEGQIW